MAEAFKPILVPEYTVNDDGDTQQTWVAVDLEAFIRGHSGGSIVTAASSWPSQMVVATRLHDGSAYNAAAIHFGVIGWGVNGCLIYPFGRLDEPEDWFNPQGLGTLDLVLTQGDADAEVNVCIQQVYPY